MCSALIFDATGALAKLAADGRQPADDKVTRMTAALKAHWDARRYDRVQNICNEFKKKFVQWNIAYTQPIERPPVPGYSKVDRDETIRRNTGSAGFNNVEQSVRDFVTNYNSAGTSNSHVEAIEKTQDMHTHLAAACKANPP